LEQFRQYKANIAIVVAAVITLTLTSIKTLAKNLAKFKFNSGITGIMIAEEPIEKATNINTPFI